MTSSIALNAPKPNNIFNDAAVAALGFWKQHLSKPYAEAKGAGCANQASGGPSCSEGARAAFENLPFFKAAAATANHLRQCAISEVVLEVAQTHRKAGNNFIANPLEAVVEIVSRTGLSAAKAFESLEPISTHYHGGAPIAACCFKKTMGVNL
jgi:hypothetical protein